MLRNQYSFLIALSRDCAVETVSSNSHIFKQKHSTSISKHLQIGPQKVNFVDSFQISTLFGAISNIHSKSNHAPQGPSSLTQIPSQQIKAHYLLTCLQSTHESNSDKALKQPLTRPNPAS